MSVSTAPLRWSVTGFCRGVGDVGGAVCVCERVCERESVCFENIIHQMHGRKRGGLCHSKKPPSRWIIPCRPSPTSTSPSSPCATHHGEVVGNFSDHLLGDLPARARHDGDLRLQLADAQPVRLVIPVDAGGHAGVDALDEGGAGEVVGDLRFPEGDHGGDEGLVLPGLAPDHRGGADGRRGDEREEADKRLVGLLRIRVCGGGGDVGGMLEGWDTMAMRTR